MTDTTDHTIALRTTLDILQWMLVRDKQRLGDQDVKKHLKDIDLVRMLLELLEDDEDE